MSKQVVHTVAIEQRTVNSLHNAGKLSHENVYTATCRRML
jgi:hypothetical protein